DPPPPPAEAPPAGAPTTLELGALAERAAASYLEGEGYELEARNWRGQAGELDIVARRGAQLVFVEVRARRGDWLARPAEAVTLSKQRQVARCADEYLRRRPAAAPPFDVVRFDVIGVAVSPPWSAPRCAFDHEEGAFESPWAF
ncbi:MAG: YraN family protein, partial [Deltaproteobacteria bacterium]|nr:YraN family protein [Deltaproteobacteria bacterium]